MTLLRSLQPPADGYPQLDQLPKLRFDRPFLVDCRSQAVVDLPDLPKVSLKALVGRWQLVH